MPITVTDLIRTLIDVPDPSTTFVFLTEDDVDEPCEYITLDSLLHV